MWVHSICARLRLQSSHRDYRYREDDGGVPDSHQRWYRSHCWEYFKDLSMVRLLLLHSSRASVRWFLCALSLSVEVVLWYFLKMHCEYRTIQFLLLFFAQVSSMAQYLHDGCLVVWWSDLMIVLLHFARSSVLFHWWHELHWHYILWNILCLHVRAPDRISSNRDRALRSHQR